MKIIIKKDAYIKLRYFVDLVPGEISGMAKTFLDEEKNVIVQDFIIFQQKCTSGSTNIDSASIAKFLYELQKNDERTEDWNMWWHSHGGLGVFWSGTDNKTIEDHAGGQPYLLSLVTNKANEYKARLDIFPKDQSPFSKVTFCTYDDLKVEIEYPQQDEQTQNIIDEIELQIKTLTEEKELFIKDYDKEIEKLNEQKGELTTVTATDVAIEQHCKDEIEAKVEKERFFTGYRASQSQGHFGRQGRFPLIGKKTKWKWWKDSFDNYAYDYTDYDDDDDDDYEYNDVPKIGFKDNSLDKFYSK